MKKIALVFFMCLCMADTVYATDIKEPNVDALGAILMDYNTGRVLWGKNEYEPLAMASTTKIMTAIYTLENANRDDIVTVSQRAAMAPEVKMKLRTGEKIKLDYLLHALMLQSSNDAAVAIAEHVSGSVEDFCEALTKKARELGAKDTIFVTPNGLDSGEHHSTAYDMALITRYALENEDFVKLINTPNVTVTSDRTSYYVDNKNRMLDEYEGCLGVKTGFTGKAGHCFVGAAKRGDMELISVVLASGWGNKGKSQKWVDTRRVLDFGFANFTYTDLVLKNTVAEQVQVGRSRTTGVNLIYSEGLNLPVTDEEMKTVRIEISAPDEILAPIEQGQKIGTASVYIGGSLYQEIDLVSSASAERHDFKTSLEKVMKYWLEMGTNADVKITLPEL